MPGRPNRIESTGRTSHSPAVVLRAVDAVTALGGALTTERQLRTTEQRLRKIADGKLIIIRRGLHTVTGKLARRDAALERE